MYLDRSKMLSFFFFSLSCGESRAREAGSVSRPRAARPDSAAAAAAARSPPSCRAAPLCAGASPCACAAAARPGVAGKRRPAAVAGARGHGGGGVGAGAARGHFSPSRRSGGLRVRHGARGFRAGPPRPGLLHPLQPSVGPAAPRPQQSPPAAAAGLDVLHALLALRPPRHQLQQPDPAGGAGELHLLRESEAGPGQRGAGTAHRQPGEAGGNKTQYDEIGIPVALLSHGDMLDLFKSFGRAAKAALYAPDEPVLDYNTVTIFLMAVGTVAIGGYWAGSRDVKRRYMKHKRDDGPEKQEDEAVDVTPVMIGVFVATCCSVLVLLYCFYDRLVYVVIGIFCLASSAGLYSCLAPFARRLPFGKCRVPNNSLPYFHKRPQVRLLLLALACVSVSVVWGVFRNEDQWAWVLQDALGIAFCLYMLKTIRLPTFKACTLLLLVLFVYDVFFVFVTPFLTKSGNSIMVEVATGPSDSATREKLPMVLKVPRLSSSPLALCDRPFSLLGFGDILVPGLLVAYCHRFDIQVQSPRVYFVACTIAYGIGLLVTFVALALMQRGQPALLYLVPCTLTTSCAVALWRRELGAFWTGSGFAKDLPQSSWAPAGADGPQPLKDTGSCPSPPPPSEELLRSPLQAEQPPEPATPQDTEAAAIAPACVPTSPAASTPAATDQEQGQPSASD